LISSCRCDPQLDPEMMAARAHACLLTARDDAVLCSTPCFSCSAVLLFVPISASRLSARECESKSVARSPARSRNAKPAVLRKSLLVVFAVKTFFFFFLIFVPFVAVSRHRVAGPGVPYRRSGSRGGVHCRAKPEAGYELSLYSLAGPTTARTPHRQGPSLHVQSTANARLGSAPAADPGEVLASVHRLEGQDVPSGGRLAGEQPDRSRGAVVSRSGRSTELA
jgi:hypothetical protein